MADLKNIGASVAAQFRGLNGRPPAQWPLVPRLMCGVGVFLVVIGLGYYFWWSNQMDDLDTGAQQEVKLREEYKTKILQANNLDALKRQKAQISEYVATLEKALPSKAEMDALLSDITHAGLGRGLQFLLFKPGQVVVKDYYAEQPIDIRVTGSYNDVGQFSSDIANLPRIVTLNNLALSSKDGELTLDKVAKTFRYLDPNEIAEQRKAAGGKKK
ncbi:MAG: type 4a pilus biogenesis protein PilO [Burkholderiaceae bacterium]|nr:type 4a pilus biogenesis protein PilO [Burkholderiaceae bacterium]